MVAWLNLLDAKICLGHDRIGAAHQARHAAGSD
jgi:hypothetical protein